MLLKKIPLERFLLGKCPQGTKPLTNISFYGKMPVGKIPTRKKGLLKIPLQNILSTHGKMPSRKLPTGKCALKIPFWKNNHSKKNLLNKNLSQNMPPRKKFTGQMPPRKSPGKKLPTYNGFWKRIPLENAFEQNTLERFLLGKCPREQNLQEIFPFTEKYPLVKCQPRKKAS